MGVTGNALLDSVIEQARKRNAQIAAEQKARRESFKQAPAPTPTILAPFVDGGLGPEDSGFSPEAEDPFYQADFESISAANPMGNGQAVMDQRAYDKAVAFNNPTGKNVYAKTLATAIAPIATVPTTIMADQIIANAQYNPNVVQDTAAQLSPMGRAMGMSTGVPSGVQSWAQAQQDNTALKSEIDNAWHAQREQFMNAEAQAAANPMGVGGALSGFGGSYGGSVNGGVAAGSPAEFNAFSSAPFESIGVGGIDGNAGSAADDGFTSMASSFENASFDSISASNPGGDGGASGDAGASDGDADAGFSGPF